MSLKFFNLHGHSGYSVYDGIGAVEDYIQWMLKNAGEDSGGFALTDHGNVNNAGYLTAAAEKYSKKGAPVKLLYGVEAYYLPSLEDWSITKFERDQKKKEEKKAKEEGNTDLVIESESESKDYSKKYYDPINRRNHLVIWAYNQKGLENLFRLVSRSYREGFYRKPRVDLSMLRDLNEGLMASTACLAGVPTWSSFHPDVQDDESKKMALYDKELSPFYDIFGTERFFLELQFNKIPEQQVTNMDIVKYAKKHNYPVIATADCHYPSPQMWRDREIYKLLGYQMLKKATDESMKELREKSIDELDCNLYLKNGDQIYAAYKESFYNQFKDEEYIRNAIERTYSIAHDQCDFVTPDRSIKLPKTFRETKEIKTAFDKLKSLVLQGLQKKKIGSKKYIDRAIYELSVINKLKVSEYFLAELEIINVLKKHMLVGPGRGSGAGSLVCYLLGITSVDPIKYNLLFERFMSASRAEMPDIDSDFELKEEALDILKDHFGADNVLAISNYNRLQLRSLVKDIAKLYGVPFQEVNDVTKVMESEAKDKIMDEIGHDQKLYEFTYEKAKEYSPTLNSFLKKYPEVGEHIGNLYQEIKSIGRHAGGVLVVPDAERHLPIIRIRGIDQSPITEGLTAHHLGYFGLIKFDVLGLATLKIIRKCIELILQKQGVEYPTIDDVWKFYDENLHPDIINPADAKIFESTYNQGNFPSIFQFTEKKVQGFAQKAKPQSVNDISAITALWRPGPLKGAADERYLHATAKDLKKEHPIIQEVLKDTRGVLLYQEQFMLLANKLAGFTLEESNKLRKILVRPEVSLGEEMKKERMEIREKFVNGCVKSGLTEERATGLWDREIMGFISYGFNKSHAVSYAFVSYQCSWLYAYYPNEWIKACLEKDPDLERTINVVRTLGYKVGKPNVNLSQVYDWNVSEDKKCVPALTSLKGVGKTAAEELVRNRPLSGFKNIQDFFFDSDNIWRWSKFNKKALSALVKVEGFEDFDCIGEDNLFENYAHMEKTLMGETVKLKKGKYITYNNLDLLKKGKATLEDLASEVDETDWTSIEKIEQQKELMGFYDKGILIEEVLPTFIEMNIEAIDENPEDGPKARVWALLEDVKEKETSKGKPYLVVKASGMTEKLYNFRVWNTEKNDLWSLGSVIVFSLEYDQKWGYNIPRNCEVIKVTK